MSCPTPHALTTSYRHLYKALLHAVQFSKPARYVARDTLRAAFRSHQSTPPSAISRNPGDVPAYAYADTTYNAARITRTLEFLRSAARVRGIEHRIVKNLVHVRWGMGMGRAGKRKGRADVLEARERAYAEFEGTVRRLNESLGLCLR